MKESHHKTQAMRVAQKLAAPNLTYPQKQKLVHKWAEHCKAFIGKK